MIYITGTVLGSLAAAIATFITLCWAGANVLMFVECQHVRLQTIEFRERQIKAVMQLIQQRNTQLHYLINLCDTVITEINRLNSIMTCPISLAIPSDPVVASSGIMFSEKMIRSHFNVSKAMKCPMTFKHIDWTGESIPLKQTCELLLNLEGTVDKLSEACNTLKNEVMKM
jgi:hypothetical protein